MRPVERRARQTSKRVCPIAHTTRGNFEGSIRIHQTYTQRKRNSSCMQSSSKVQLHSPPKTLQARKNRTRIPHASPYPIHTQHRTYTQSTVIEVLIMNRVTGTFKQTSRTQPPPPPPPRACPMYCDLWQQNATRLGAWCKHDR